MKIIIFRHGEKQPSNGITDLELRRSRCLSSNGISQIEKLGNTILKNYSEFANQKYIYSSTYPRTIQSAEIVRNILGIGEIKAHPVFKELYAFKDYSITKEKQVEMNHYALENLNYINTTGYSFSQRIDEMIEFFKKLYEEGEENIIVSAHGAIIRAMLLSIGSVSREKILSEKMRESGYVLFNYNENNFTILDISN